MDDKPCCIAAAARKTRRVTIGGRSVGIDRLDEIMDEVEAMRLQDHEIIGEALLKKVKIFNYVPPSAVPEYTRALLEEYKRRG